MVIQFQLQEQDTTCGGLMSINHRHIHFSIITINKHNYCQDDWQRLPVLLLRVCWEGNLLDLTDSESRNKRHHAAHPQSVCPPAVWQKIQKYLLLYGFFSSSCETSKLIYFLHTSEISLISFMAYYLFIHVYICFCEWHGETTSSIQFYNSCKMINKWALSLDAFHKTK